MKKLAIKKFESTFNRYLSLDSETPKLLTPLQGKVMGIHIQRPKISLFFAFEENKVHISTEQPATVNTEIYTTVFQLIRLKMNQNPALVNTQFHIKGDVDTAQLLNALFQKHQIDWEEHLSKILGDIAAYKMTQLFRKPIEFMRRNKTKFSSDLSEYLQEEAQLLPSGNEVEIFRKEVDLLRLQMDRLQARVELLKKKI